MYEDRIQIRKELQGQISSLERSLATSQELLSDRGKLMMSLEARNTLLMETIEAKNAEINELSSLKKQMVLFSQVLSERDILLNKVEIMNESGDLIHQLQSRLLESETKLNEMNSSLEQVEEQRRLNHDLQLIVSNLQIRIDHLEELLLQKDDHIQADQFALEAEKIQNQELRLALSAARNEME
jgi:hypothetical protein